MNEAIGGGCATRVARATGHDGVPAWHVRLRGAIALAAAAALTCAVSGPLPAQTEPAVEGAQAPSGGAAAQQHAALPAGQAPAMSPVPEARPAESAPATRTPASAASRGPVTNLPLPRYVSLKTDEGNARRGPSLAHRIDWVYTRRSMPLEVTAEFGHWRRVRDRDGAGGWVHYALLSGVRTVLVERDMVAMRQHPRHEARILARAEAGVVARLGECERDWCRISAQGQRGWVPKSALWGVGAEELRD